MEKVLIGIEREKFLYLYKYNSCFISISSIVEIDNKELFSIKARGGNDALAKSLEEALPFFENEDEVVFLVYEKKHISFKNRISLVFQGVQDLIPLNEIAYNVIKSKINQNFRLSKPLPSALFDKIHGIKQEKIRTESVSKIRSLFRISKVKDETTSSAFFALLKKNINEILLKDTSYDQKSAFSQLLRYDTTPNFAPEGNVESFIKLGCIALKAVGVDESNLIKGPYYTILEKNKHRLNQLTLKQSYETLKGLFKKEPKENKLKIEKLEEILGTDFPTLNTFLIYYLFLSFNRILSAKDFNLLFLKKDIEELKKTYPEELAYAMVLFAYIHSYERLYESFHRLSNAPLFKTSKPIVEPENRISVIKEPIEKIEPLEQVVDKESKDTKQKQNKDNKPKINESSLKENGSAKSKKDGTNKVVELSKSKAPGLFDKEPNAEIKTSNRNELTLEITNEQANRSLSNLDVKKIEASLRQKSDKKYLIEIHEMLNNKEDVTKEKVTTLFKNEQFRKKDDKLTIGANRVYQQILKILE
jgi:hypothetical protein